MTRTLSLLMRGVIADNAQAIHDAHAVTILRQQIRDAAGALATARRELAVAMAYHAAETRALAAIGTRIDTLSDGARRALATAARISGPRRRSTSPPWRTSGPTAGTPPSASPPRSSG